MILNNEIWIAIAGSSGVGSLRAATSPYLYKNCSAILALIIGLSLGITVNSYLNVSTVVHPSVKVRSCPVLDNNR